MNTERLPVKAAKGAVRELRWRTSLQGYIAAIVTIELMWRVAEVFEWVR